MSLEDIRLCEISLTHKGKCYVASLFGVCNLKVRLPEEWQLLGFEDLREWGDTGQSMPTYQVIR
jgi:hypothetical protein